MNRLQYRSHPGVLLAAVALVAVALLVRRQSTTTDTCHEMEPERVAALEAGGWKAYYDRDWPRVLMLMVQMNRTQFCMGWLDAMTGALDIVRAAAAFAPVCIRKLHTSSFQAIGDAKEFNERTGCRIDRRIAQSA